MINTIQTIGTKNEKGKGEWTKSTNKDIYSFLYSIGIFSILFICIVIFVCVSILSFCLFRLKHLFLSFYKRILSFIGINKQKNKDPRKQAYGFDHPLHSERVPQESRNNKKDTKGVQEDTYNKDPFCYDLDGLANKKDEPLFAFEMDQDYIQQDTSTRDSILKRIRTADVLDCLDTKGVQGVPKHTSNKSSFDDNRIPYCIPGINTPGVNK